MVRPEVIQRSKKLQETPILERIANMREALEACSLPRFPFRRPSRALDDGS